MTGANDSDGAGALPPGVLVEPERLAPLVSELVRVVADAVAERLRGPGDQPASGAPTVALLTKAALATALDVSTATVDRLVRDGRIPCFTVGDARRFDLQEVREALRERRPPTAERQLRPKSLPRPDEGQVVWAPRRGGRRVARAG